MENINEILNFIKNVVITTFGHLAWLLGLILIFGLILYLLALFTRRSFVKSSGPKLDIIFTGWIGTPVHELGHALFCILFRHRIVEMKLYDPNPQDGSLGYVNHSYNPKSRYQNIGNFFIGIGPILFGAFVLYALFYYLLPDLKGVFTAVETKGAAVASGLQTGSWLGVYEALRDTSILFIRQVFNPGNFATWQFWVFLYLSICVASHMELSPPDIKGAKSGLISLILLLLFFNLIVLGVEAFGWHTHLGGFWSYLKLETYAAHINSFLGVLGSLFVLATIVSAINFILSFIILSIYSVIKGNRMFNPFWR